MKHTGNLLWFTLCLHLGLPASAAEPLAVVSPGAVLPRVVAAEGRQVWYSLYFDPQHLWIYAATDGYDDSADSLVGKYAHQITTIGGNGAVYLKLSGRGVKLNEISLSGGPVRSAAGNG